MLFVHAPGQAMTFQTDKAVMKGGSSYELYVYRSPRFVVAGVSFMFVLGSLAFLVYALFSQIDNLWIYATSATAVTAFLTCLFVYLALALNYERISLAGSFANAYACQHALLVIKQKGAPVEGWFAANFTLFIKDREAHLYASADFRKLDPASLKKQKVRKNQRMARALQRRSFVQTDSTDLRDYLRSAAIRNQFLLAKRAGLGVRHD